MRSTFNRQQLAFLVSYFGIVSFAVSQPIFGTIDRYREEFHFDFYDAILMVAVFQYGVSVLLFLIRQVFPSPLRGIVDGVVLFGLTLILLRHAQLNYLTSAQFSGAMKLTVALAAIVCAAIIASKFKKVVIQGLFFAGCLAPIFGVVFLNGQLAQSISMSLSSQPHPATSSARPVIMIIMDEFSLPVILDESGDINAQAYPNFHRLSRNSIWYKNAMANSPVTSASFPNILTGKYIAPKGKDGRFNIESLPPPNLLETLRDNGYSISIYSSYFSCQGEKYYCYSFADSRRGWFLAKVALRFLSVFIPERIGLTYFPYFIGWSWHDAHNVIHDITESSKRGSFHLVHLTSSHYPYIFNAEGGYRFSPHQNLLPGASIELSLAGYREQLQYVDKIIGRTLEIWERRTKSEQPIIMIISDHGLCWGPRCQRGDDPEKMQDIVPELTDIPAFLMLPGSKNTVDQRDFQLIDVFPTLMDATGLNGTGPNPPMDGFSGLRPAPDRRPRLFFRGGNTAAVPIALHR